MDCVKGKKVQSKKGNTNTNTSIHTVLRARGKVVKEVAVVVCSLFCVMLFILHHHVRKTKKGPFLAQELSLSIVFIRDLADRHAIEG